MNENNLLGKTLSEITEIARELEMPGYAAGQIADWLYKKKVGSVDDMTNLPKAAREKLKNLYSITLSPPVQCHQSHDGTHKYLYSAGDGKYVEAVYIPETNRSTLCISSQVGCKMGCAFCMTGLQGFSGNLSPGDIINQIISLPERDRLTNYVFMGMGEPLANTGNVLKTLEIMTSSYGLGLSPSRITVSTIGILSGLEHIIDKTRCHIAISLHSPFDSERVQLVPIEKVYPIKRVIDLLKAKMNTRQRRISFEYIMFKGINDTARHVNGLTRLLNGLKCRINLIRYHAIPDLPFEASDDETINWFKSRLNEKGVLTTLRASRGEDIFAACGMLSTKQQMLHH